MRVVNKLRTLKIQQNSAGFSLLEIILVLALIGALAAVILPGLRFTAESQMRVAIRDFTEQLKATYNQAIFSNRTMRMIVDIKTGSFWVEQAPSNFNGRPPDASGNSVSIIQREALKSLLADLQQRYKQYSDRETVYSTVPNKLYYSVRSIPLVRAKALQETTWSTYSDSVIRRQQLPKQVAVARFISNISTEVLEYNAATASTDKQKKFYGIIYFLPDGTTTEASIRLGMQNDGRIMEVGQKYTLNLNTLTGETHLLEGFQDAAFVLPKK